MAQPLKMIATKPDYVSWGPRSHSGVQTRFFSLGKQEHRGYHMWPSGFLSVQFLLVLPGRWLPVLPHFEGHQHLPEKNVHLIFMDCVYILTTHEQKIHKVWLIQKYFTVLASKVYYGSKSSWVRFRVYLYNGVFSVYFTNCLSYG